MIWKRLLENRCPKCVSGRRLDVIGTNLACPNVKCGFGISAQVMGKICSDIQARRQVEPPEDDGIGIEEDFIS